METKYAPPERVDDTTIHEQLTEFQHIPLFTEIFNAIDSVACVINKQRQVVYVNKSFSKSFNVPGFNAILGKRPGEIIGCIHANEEKAGCGTSSSCSFCGAVQAVLESQQSGRTVTRESRITMKSETGGDILGADVLVTATPFHHGENVYSILTLKDISSEKRKSILEKLFFHDITNTIGGLNGLLKMLSQMPDKNDGARLIEISERSTANIMDEINSYRQIAQAESGDLALNITSFTTIAVIKETVDRINYHDISSNKFISIDEKTVPLLIVSDYSILSRILMNMLKNALEATPKSGFVSIGADLTPEAGVRIWVRNQGVLPDSIRSQIFQRSFSTKGTNRGIGTYSIKLLGETYLKGRVDFLSNEKQQTEFFITLPQKLPGAQTRQFFEAVES